MKKFIIVIVVFLLAGCAVSTANRITRADSKGKFRVGMSYEDVISIVGRGPTNSDIYTETMTAGGVHKFWRVNGKCDGWDPVGMYRFYSFEFENNKLTSWSWNK